MPQAGNLCEASPNDFGSTRVFPECFGSKMTCFGIRSADLTTNYNDPTMNNIHRAMKNSDQSVLSHSTEYEDFKHWLGCFERDLRKAWKKKMNQNPVQAELDDPLTDEMLDLGCAKERLITAIVRVCDEVEFAPGDDTTAN